MRELASKNADVEQAEARLKEAAARLSTARNLADSARRRLDAARSVDQSRERRMAAIDPERKKIAEEMDELSDQLDLASGERDRLNDELQRLHDGRRECLVENTRLVSEAKSMRENVAALGNGLHQAELNRTRADARRSNALARLAEDYGINAEDLSEQGEPQPPPPDAPAMVQRLRRELRAMGNVNLGAVEAFERMSKRFDELTAQKADVEGGIAEVEQSIRELDNLTRDRFINTFAAVQTAFKGTFERLFGGGEGNIYLSTPEDVLNTGIELEVTLPGKRRQALTLLSGGERSLCTAAFLFALLEVKPSPLVVLDEVDAPLDGRNVERFAEMLKSFSSTTQFIVITHNPVTIEAAPDWIGVSMQEPGISTLVPVHAPEARTPAALSL
jgi:chromosome segregation protein